MRQINYVYLRKDELQYILRKRGVTSIPSDVFSCLHLIKQSGKTELDELNFADIEMEGHLALLLEKAEEFECIFTIFMDDAPTNNQLARLRARVNHFANCIDDLSGAKFTSDETIQVYQRLVEVSVCLVAQLNKLSSVGSPGAVADPVAESSEGRGLADRVPTEASEGRVLANRAVGNGGCASVEADMFGFRKLELPNPLSKLFEGLRAFGGESIDSNLNFLRFLVNFQQALEMFPVSHQQAFRLLFPYVTSLLRDLLRVAIRENHTLLQFHDSVIQNCFPVALRHHLLSRFFFRPQGLQESLFDYVTDIRFFAKAFRLQFSEADILDNILRGLNRDTRSCLVLSNKPNSFEDLFSVYARVAEIQYFEKDRQVAENFDRQWLSPTMVRAEARNEVVGLPPRKNIVRNSVASVGQRCQSELPMISVIIDESPVTALIDSGSTYSLLSRKFFGQLSASQNIIQNERCFSSCLAANSEEFKVEGPYTLTLCIQQLSWSWKFRVVDELNHPCVLGIDFLVQTQASLSAAKRFIEFPYAGGVSVEFVKSGLAGGAGREEIDKIENVVEQQPLTDIHESHQVVTTCTNIRTQPQMICSNSSVGAVGGFHSQQPPLSPTANKLQRSRTFSNSRNHNTEFRSFRGPSSSSFRGDSPHSKVLQPTLADFELPPPPADLPPPPEEFDCVNETNPLTPEPPPLATASPNPERRRSHVNQHGSKANILLYSPHNSHRLGHGTGIDPSATRLMPLGPCDVDFDFESVPHVDQCEQEKDCHQSIVSSDVRNTEPSVEEASSRFGVSLRRREPSTDSCSSVKSCGEREESGFSQGQCNRRCSKSRPRDRPPSPPKSTHSLTSPLCDIKSPLSPNSDIPLLYSTTSVLQEPSSVINCFNEVEQKQVDEVENDQSSPVADEAVEKKSCSKLLKNVSCAMKEMLELKLVAEIKERADTKLARTGCKESPNREQQLCVILADPSAQLTSDLAESSTDEAKNFSDSVSSKALSDTSNKGSVSPVETKPNIRKFSRGSDNGKLSEQPTGGLGSLKAQLKKFDPQNKRVVKEDTDECSVSIIDFKSRLRKVESGGEKMSDRTVKKTVCDKLDVDDQMSEEERRRNSVSADSECLEVDSKKRDSTLSSHSLDSAPLKMEEGEDKRRSTGSISSLKKLWENKETSGDFSSGQVSPKLGLKSVNKSDVPVKNSREVSGDDSDDKPKIEDTFKDNYLPEEVSSKSSKQGATEKRVWPPITVDEKPAVPTKPMVKAVKPVIQSPKMSGVPAIYATPTLPKLSILGKTCASPGADSRSDDEFAGRQNGDGDVKGGKESVLEISQALETSLTSLRSSSNVSAGSWLQLSDKVGLFHSSCVSYADRVAPHARFHFRELLTRLETQAQQLRSAGARNTADNTRLFTEVQNTVKDVINAVQR